MNIKYIFILLFSFFLFSCNEKTKVDENNFQKRSDKLFYLINKQSLFTGEAESHYHNGQLATVINFEDGKKNGNAKQYLENGQLEFDYNYKDGKLDCNQEEYLEN